MAVAARIDQEGGHRAVGFFLCRDGGEADHHMRLARDLHQQARRIVGLGRIPLEQLLGGHDDLVGGLAPPAAPAHSVRHDAQDTPVDPGVVEKSHAVLLVVTVSLVDAGGRRESVAFGHCVGCSRRSALGKWVSNTYYPEPEPNPSRP